ncbi:homing endonuclease [Rhizobium phage vB_RleM_P10VF]|uniref:Putative endonuclease n=1 Tax=Rhizobium phage vB_RleM_P10VF TaxID=1527770 RepID=A0A076YNG6_9CAUD|nr:homing endonuclease [Rhizobium phage vB_RleM_P10VF]AIK68334.1 putative endonuclease [Rhizobium phage vB_RleM_P10VF]
MYGFVYLTTNTINGMKYVGRHKGNPDKDQKYLGSGKLFTRAVRKYGRDVFERETLQICETKEKLFEAEEFWIRKLDAVASSNFYNVTPYSIGGCEPGRTLSEKTRAKMRKPHGPMPEERKERISISSMGRRHSPETRAKISAGNKGNTKGKLGRVDSPETIAKRVETRMKNKEAKLALLNV